MGNRKKDNPTPEERENQEKTFEEYQKNLRAKRHEEATLRRKEKEMDDKS